MPATDKVWRNLKTVHVVFAASSIALFLVTVWMLAADHSEEWHETQRKAEQIVARKIELGIQSIKTQDYEAKLNSLQTQLKESTDALAAEETELEPLRQKLKAAELEVDLASRAVRAQNAVKGKASADYDIAVRDQRSEQVLAASLANFEREQARAEDLQRELQRKEAALNELQAQLAERTKTRDEIQAELNRLQTDADLLHKSLVKIEPDNWFSAAKRKIMQWPVIDGFNSPRKVQQDWLPDLSQRLGMASTARFDRCRTCHSLIDRIDAGDVPTFPFGHPSSDNIDDWIKENKFPHPFATHPRPELYLTGASPHPLGRYGCTVCHDGQGSGTNFSTAAHLPNDPYEQEVWHEKYHFQTNHFWEYPMLPDRFRESSCLKCHHHVVELGVNSQYGASAPKVYRGYQLIERYGCFGCHEINGYEGGIAIGPDLRLEPQTQEEKDKIAADPTLVAGTMRKVGPSLRHIASKTTQGWVEYWTQEPKRFRPTTRMPQFFGLTNQQDANAQALQPVEIAGIAQYLFDKSQPLELMSPAEGYEPNAERGKALFSRRGCLACHSHKDFNFPELTADFGPDLSRVHAKIKPGEDGFLWLYTWVRDPNRHFPRTRMPNVFLEPYEQQGETIDPAADIAAFLLLGGPENYQPLPLPPYIGLEFDRDFTAAEAQSLGLDGSSGVRVNSVFPNSPAKRAVTVIDGKEVAKPVQESDVVLDFNGQSVSSAEELTALVESTSPGTTVTLDVLRHGQQLPLEVVVDEPLNDMVRLYVAKTLSFAQTEEFLESRQYPIVREKIKGDEIELYHAQADGPIDDVEWERMRLSYIGRRSITRYGCFGCHDIAEFETARPIGTALQDWGRKDTSRLAFEHIDEWLHHHGEPDGSSTRERVEEALHRAGAGEFSTEEQKERELSAAFYYENLMHHGRPGFLWQKLRQPRSYDYEKIETKGYDERLRMPKFPLGEEDIGEIATFVLGLVADPPAAQYIYRPEGAPLARIEGERLLEKYNCSGCHMVELPQIRFAARLDEITSSQLQAIDHPESVDLLLQLKPPQNGLTKETASVPTADGGTENLPVVAFHGLLSSLPDPEEEDPELKQYSYVLWETLQVGEALLWPSEVMSFPEHRLVESGSGRGGAFTEWLVESLMKTATQNDRGKARQMAPPPLYKEGIKVQTPWLYQFLRDPVQLRHTTVLRMPRFNMDADEARSLADYFAAVDGASFPYQEIREREPEYVARMDREHAELIGSDSESYLSQAWKLVNAPVCIKCHSVGGRQVQIGNPQTDIRGPNLDLATDRLRPDWLLLWLYKPAWITPYTSMPAPFPRGQQAFPDLLGGDASVQTKALRDALMNYNRLMEEQGKTIYEPPAGEAAQPAAGAGG